MQYSAKIKKKLAIKKKKISKEKATICNCHI